MYFSPLNAGGPGARLGKKYIFIYLKKILSCVNINNIRLILSTKFASMGLKFTYPIYIYLPCGHKNGADRYGRFLPFLLVD